MKVPVGYHPGVQALPSLAGKVTAPVSAAFGLLARARGDRALHPKGEVWRATVRPTPAGRCLTGGDCEAVVRFSRATGLPEWLPDVHGLAIRLLAFEHIDILLSSSSRRMPWTLVPSFDLRGTYSSLAHYDLDGTRVRLLAEADFGRLTLFSEADGALTELAEIVLERRSDEEIRFHPAETGSHLTPLGPVNALRAAAYQASQDSGLPDR